MISYERAAYGLELLRNAAADLKQWRPPSERKLRAMRERIELFGLRPEQSEDLVGIEPRDWDDWEDDRPGNASSEAGAPGPSSLPTQHASSRGLNLQRGTLRPQGAAIAGSWWQRVSRKMHSGAMELRWLGRRVKRVGLIAQPTWLATRRILGKWRRTLIFLFVVAACLVTLF